METRAGAPALDEARQQALLIAALRGGLGAAGFAAAIVRGVHPGPAVGLFLFGAALVLVSIYGGGRPARSAAKFANPEPKPAEARMQTPWRGGPRGPPPRPGGGGRLAGGPPPAPPPPPALPAPG